MELEGSLLCSQELTIGVYFKPAEYDPHLSILLL